VNPLWHNKIYRNLLISDVPDHNFDRFKGNDDKFNNTPNIVYQKLLYTHFKIHHCYIFTIINQDSN